MKKDSVKRGITLSLLSILLCILLLIGTTFAWFTDSVTSSGNRIQAGTLKVDLELLDFESGLWKSIKNDKTPLFCSEQWEPGYTEVKLLRIENEGSLSLSWVAKFNASKSLSKLADAIDVYVLAYGVLEDGTDVTYPVDRNLESYTNVGTLRTFIESLNNTTQGFLAGHETAYLGIALKMPENVGNAYQGLDLGGTFDIQIVATQAAYEKDTFDDQYDGNIELPAIVSSPQQLKDAMLVRNAEIVLEDDIVVDASTPTQWGSYMFVANGREVTIDLNGHDIVLDETASNNILYMFTTANGGTLNIVGEGNLIANNGTSGICWAMNKNDQINIYGGDFYSNGTDWSKGNSLIYTTSGSIDVYGGTFHRAGSWCANVSDAQGSRICIVFHEGVLFVENDIQNGDSARIKLADGCVIKAVVINGETWYQIIKE